ncbi:hypothetical protein CJ263_10710 [Maribacter cobaltidurans]|uniref:Uncharacterized protein n=2 Tax=Maribacter cobaltidurans TaxID=1178778 RepID=A0A223V5F0_9FLAO|nr:hypothetical protein CJ263_10710 [Maribacter cobaltidurans]GGD80551.1 hypothetical protein GCM10011412_17890 [Maribacter cobaltidurans]
MWNSLSLENKEWWIVVILVGLLLLAVFIWKEWKGKPDRRFYINSFLGFVAILCLSFLVLRPTYLQKVRGEAVLLTEGYQKEILDSLKKNNRRISEIEYRPGMDLSSKLDSIEHLFIMGHGVRESDLWQLKSDNVTFLPSQISEGIIKLKYNQNESAGSDLMVQGIYRNQNARMKLTLKGPGENTLDSISFLNKGDHHFKLKTNLKVDGKFLYHITEQDSAENIINTEALPVIVTANKPLKILIVNEFPSFETKYLKNFLSEEGHEVTVKTKLTKQQYKFEYFNTDQVAIYSLNRENIGMFDLMVFDDQSLKNLSKSERNILMEQVSARGLGVFVQQTGNNFQSKNSLGQLNTLPDEQTQVKLDMGSNPVLEKYHVQFDSMGLMGMIIGNYGYSLQIGQGHIGSTFLKNTYQLLLDGKDSDYRELWSSLINGIRKRSEKSAQFHSDSYWASVNEPFHFSFFSSELDPKIRVEKQYQVPLIKNSVVSDEWMGTVYPKRAGWHQLQSESDSSSSLNYYVMEEGLWKSLTDYNTLKRNKRFFSKNPSKIQEKFLPQRISPIWFLTIFILVMGYLWLEPKLR